MQQDCLLRSMKERGTCRRRAFHVNISRVAFSQLTPGQFLRLNSTHLIPRKASAFFSVPPPSYGVSITDDHADMQVDIHANTTIPRRPVCSFRSVRTACLFPNHLLVSLSAAKHLYSKTRAETPSILEVIVLIISQSYSAYSPRTTTRTFAWSFTRANFRFLSNTSNRGHFFWSLGSARYHLD